MYKRCATILAKPLLHLFQQSLYCGTVLIAWKVAKVYPLYKDKGKRSSASSYRPISLTSVVSKILERLFVRSLGSYMDDNNLLNSKQHGFRCGRSTVTNLLSFNKNIVEFLNNGSACNVIMIDFCRAFYKADHTVLYDKLKKAGIDGYYLKWMVDYLQYRKQFVALLSISDVTSGVVQGTYILPYKAKRVYLDENLKIIIFLFFTYSSTTFYSASNGVILFLKFEQFLIKFDFEIWVYCTVLSYFYCSHEVRGVSVTPLCFQLSLSLVQSEKKVYFLIT